MAPKEDKSKKKPKKGEKEKASPSIMDRLFKKKEVPKTPIQGFKPRIKNFFKQHFRGVMGVIVPLCALSWQGERFNHAKTVELMWMWVFWSFLWQPVNVPVSGLIPIFLLPMAAVLSSVNTCRCYMNENVLLFIISSMVLLLLNNSGVDRRVITWFLCSGDSCQFSAKRMIFKCSTAAFFMSMFSNRLIITSMITQYVTTALMQVKTFAASAKSGGPEPNFDEVRYIVNNAIQTASGIGSLGILHAAPVTVLFRSIFSESPSQSKEFPDIFNYLQYSAFAFPVAFVMFVLNFSYHMLLANWILKKPMSSASMTEIRRILLRYKAELPVQLTLHEKLSIFFFLLYLMVFLFRWSDWIDGWAEFSRDELAVEIPRVKDVSTAALFVIALHATPKSYGFLKYLTAKKKSQLPPLKSESAVLWWRFVDKNVNYGYFFVFGAGTAIVVSAHDSGLDEIIGHNFGTAFTKYSWAGSLFLVCFISSLLCNMMTAAASCAVFLPLVISMAQDAQIPWPSKYYVGALGVGMSSSFGFFFPFKYTPSYFCYHTGKVPVKKMCKYSFLSVWICMITLWVALLIWAPFLFDPQDNGILPVFTIGKRNATEPA